MHMANGGRENGVVTVGQCGTVPQGCRAQEALDRF